MTFQRMRHPSHGGGGGGPVQADSVRQGLRSRRWDTGLAAVVGIKNVPSATERKALYQEAMPVFEFCAFRQSPMSEGMRSPQEMLIGALSDFPYDVRAKAELLILQSCSPKRAAPIFAHFRENAGKYGSEDWERLLGAFLSFEEFRNDALSALKGEAPERVLRTMRNAFSFSIEREAGNALATPELASMNRQASERIAAKSLMERAIASSIPLPELLGAIRQLGHLQPGETGLLYVAALEIMGSLISVKSNPDAQRFLEALPLIKMFPGDMQVALRKSAEESLAERRKDPGQRAEIGALLRSGSLVPMTNAPANFLAAASNIGPGDWLPAIAKCLNPRVLAIRIFIELPEWAKSLLKGILPGGRMASVKNALLLDPKVTIIDETRAKVKFGGRTLVFVHPAGSIGDLGKAFFEENFDWLESRGKTVVEIGANIGATSIRLALEGAGKIYAFEPYPYAFGMARANVHAAGLDGKIEVINKGLAAWNGEILIPPSFESKAGSDLKRFPDGTKVGLVGLKDIVEMHGLRGKDPVLVCDCEGAENALLKEDAGTLRVFGKMMIEYHYGYKNLARSLASAGFSVEVTQPAYNYNYVAGRRMLIGDLAAQRIGE